MRSSIILLPLLLWACSDKNNDHSNQQQNPTSGMELQDNQEELEEEKDEYSEEEKEEYSEEEKEEYSEEEKEEEKEEGSEEEKEEYSEEEKEEGSEYDECSSSFDPQSSCTGSWEETICRSEGIIWWCQDGLWMNETEK